MNWSVLERRGLKVGALSIRRYGESMKFGIKELFSGNSWCRILTGGVKGLNELILLIVLLDSLVMKPHKTAINPCCTGNVDVYSKPSRFWLRILNRNYFFKTNSTKVGRVVSW